MDMKGSDKNNNVKRRLILPPLILYMNLSMTKVDLSFAFFTDQIFLAYKCYIGRMDSDKERVSSRIVKQCHFCESFFAKNEDAMKKHLPICPDRHGITY